MIRQQKPSKHLHLLRLRMFALAVLLLVAFSNAFQTHSSPNTPLSSSLIVSPTRSSMSSVGLFESTQQQDGTLTSTTPIWLPKLRRFMGGIALAGAIETGYLTYNKLFQGVDGLPFCDVDGGGCNDILSGPYSYVPFTEIPLSALGFLAYCSVAFLALSPLFSATTTTMNDENGGAVVVGDDDMPNRVALLGVTTTMGTFSIFLMALLFGVLQTTCPYCVFSAACSIILAKTAWIGGCLPEGNKNGIRWATTGFLTSTVTAVLLFVNAAVSNIDSVDTSGGVGWGGGTLIASTASGSGSSSKQLYPPQITTESSREAIDLATTLQGMNAKMYGAYWCSHCYDQKEVFGKEAFAKIQYVECSKDGANSNMKLCRAMDVPGYPTWEIDGKLYPGQQELDEIQDLVNSIKEGKQ